MINISIAQNVGKIFEGDANEPFKNYHQTVAAVQIGQFVNSYASSINELVDACVMYSMEILIFFGLIFFSRFFSFFYIVDLYAPLKLLKCILRFIIFFEF